jgi:hypothetical protein
MNQTIKRLQNIGLRLVTVFFAAIAFLVIPAFSNSVSVQAQAAETRFDPADPYAIDSETIEKVKDMAEDHVGDRGSIGNTGLKNIKKLGENISETTDVIRSQRFDNDRGADMGDPRVVQDKNYEGISVTKDRAPR